MTKASLVAAPGATPNLRQTLDPPLVGDEERDFAWAPDVIHPYALGSLTVRSVLVSGPDEKVELTLAYPARDGRNFAEMLRVVDSLQLTARHAVATAADRQRGQGVNIVPLVSDDQARGRFAGGFKALDPYPCIVPQP